MVFVAELKRINGRFFKMARCPKSMGAHPIKTSTRNLSTYLRAWPTQQGKYLAFGSTHPGVLQQQQQQQQQGTSSLQQCRSSCLHTSARLLGASELLQTNNDSAEQTPYGSSEGARPQPKVTIPKLHKMKRDGVKITMVTAYDWPSAKLADQSGIDLILVGDSLGMVVLGYKSTVPVTMQQMIHHSIPVSHAASRPLVIGDLPFGSYTTEGDGVSNAMRLIKEGGVDAVKLEGGERVAFICRALTQSGIAVMGHVGLTPQSHVMLGGYRCQGRSEKQAAQILRDALALQDAGCFAIVLECVPHEVAESVTQALKVPTIGIGSGNCTSGQVLVWHDMMGISSHAPRFAKRFTNVNEACLRALRQYKSEVISGTFPGESHTVYKDSGRVSVGSTGGFSCSSKRVDELCVAVVGGGALGSLIAARLSRVLTNHKIVQFSNRPSHVEALTQHGIRVVEVDGSITQCVNVSGANTPTNAQHGPFDVVFICTTADMTTHATELASRIMGKAGVLVTLQNGWVMDDVLKVVGAERVVVGLTSVPCSRESVSNKPIREFEGITVFANGNGSSTFVGVGSGEVCVPGDVLNVLTALFNAAGLEARHSTPDKWLELVWTKLAVNSVINPITSLVHAPNAVIASPALNQITRAVVAEVCAVYRASTEAPLDQAKVFELVQTVAAHTGNNRSSMLQHITDARPTEVDAILGHVVRTAAISNVPTPVCSTLLALVLARSQQRQRQRQDSAAAATSTITTVPSTTLTTTTTDVGGSDVPPRMLRSIAELREWRSEASKANKYVTLVPTMGCLHQGHLSLIDTARSRGASSVVVSIFVNPTQFSAGEDLDAYPRTLEADMAQLTSKGVDAVFVPRVSDMYPLGTSHESHGAVVVEPRGFAANTREGQSRPHFFAGVATVCTKLFCAVQPNAVVFGQKDFVQCAMIKRLVADLLMPIEVHISETLREHDGLAMSSRNTYLTPPLRAAAPCVYRSLQAADSLIRTHGNTHAGTPLPVSRVVDAVASVLKAEPLCASIDYVSVADCESGLDVTQVCAGDRVCISLAVRMRCGDVSVRLIDNLVVGGDEVMTTKHGATDRTAKHEL